MTIPILLIEDNPSDVELVRTAFDEVGIPAHYTIFRDGEEAINGIRLMANSQDLPRLVLLDLNLPRTSGHEVLVEMRSLPEFKTTPIIVFSTSNHPVDRNRCFAAGADDYQVKPPHFDDLIALVVHLRSRWLEAPQ